MVDLAERWTLDPEVVYLNHGAFGACPRAVLEVQNDWRARLEREPVRFYDGELEPHLDEVRVAVGDLVRAEPADVVFVPNATAGVNTVLASFPFEAGDELLMTNHAYNACANAARFWAGRRDATVAVASVPFPLKSADEIVDAVLAKVGPRTRLALLDHVTSPTALVFPIERLVRELSDRGVETLVDGAHAPGMLALDVPAIGATFYTGNLHKWCCAPKSAAFLWVKRERQAGVRPLVISHGATATRADRSRFLLEFDWPGTVDVTALLSVPAAIQFLKGLWPGGLDELRRKNRELAIAARRTLIAALGTAPVCPDTMLGSLAAVLFPAADQGPSATELHDRLRREHHIQVPIVPWEGQRSGFVRISAQAYNRPWHYERLAAALRRELAL